MFIRRNNQSSETSKERKGEADIDPLIPESPQKSPLAFLNASNQLPQKKTSLAEREAERQAQAVPPGWGSANTWGRPLKQAQGLFCEETGTGTNPGWQGTP